jgi:hypothetical protein
MTEYILGDSWTAPFFVGEITVRVTDFIAYSTGWSSSPPDYSNVTGINLIWDVSNHVQGPANDPNFDAKVVSFTSTAIFASVADLLTASNFTHFTNLETVSCPFGDGYLAKNAFKGLSKLTHVSFPALTGFIGEEAFDGCSALQTIGFPVMSEYIDQYAFNECSVLEQANFPMMAGSIGTGAFVSCLGLVDVHFPLVTAGVGTGAFADCPALTQVEFPSLITFGTDPALTENFIRCDSLSVVSLPVLTDTIPQLCFSQCSSLTEVHAPMVTELKLSCFRACTSLGSIYLPACTEVGDDAFTDCTALRAVCLPAVVTVSNNLSFPAFPAGIESYYTPGYTPADGVTTVNYVDVFPWVGTDFDLLAPYLSSSPGNKKAFTPEAATEAVQNFTVGSKTYEYVVREAEDTDLNVIYIREERRVHTCGLYCPPAWKRTRSSKVV